MPAVRGIKSNKDKPLTLLSIQFMKTRLFIQEYVGKCYDEEIGSVYNMKKSTKMRIFILAPGPLSGHQNSA